MNIMLTIDFYKMRKTNKRLYVSFVVLAALFLFNSCTKQPGKRPVDYVDPFISTEDDHGQWHPSALVPFGMVKLGPDTYPSSLTGDGDFAHSGYNYADSMVRGFSHFHKGSSGGTAIRDRAGNLSVMPFTGNPSESFFKKPVAAIDKSTETAFPGFYSVFLNQAQIQVELTAATHVGMHRYTFPAGEQANLFINEGRTTNTGVECQLVDDHTIEGIQKSHGGIYFIMKFNTPIQSTRAWNGDKWYEADHIENQEDGGLICNFGDLAGKTLEVRVGVSLTSHAAARKNLATECPEWDFPALKQKAKHLWNEKLAKIQVEGNDEYKTIFYTALYRTCFLPVVISDVDGTYPGLDKKVHHAEGYKHYTDYAFWDSFRTKYPLYSFYLPGVYQDIVKSLRDIYQQADNAWPFPDSDHKPHGHGYLLKGENRFQVFTTCRHEHMLMVMADAYVKNLFDIDIHEVYPYMKEEAMVQMPEKYDSIGYIPARPDQTGEYAWNSWGLAQVAKSIGNQADYDFFMKRSDYWKNTWDPEIKYFRARAADGTWLDFPEDPTVNREKYTYEGSQWQYRWNILHDVPALIEKFGGREQFVGELEYFFENDLYTAGNQIDLHAPFLFNPAGAPWLSQKWTHKILTQPIVQLYGTHDFFPEPIFDRVYKATPDGYLEEMDDDYGCMAGWYVMGAMGLFQICPGDPVYQITSPIFEKITINLDSTIYPGKSFSIMANNLTEKNHYIQSATLNGKPLNRCWISHDEIVKGGELVFEMGPEPNKEWGLETKK